MSRKYESGSDLQQKILKGIDVLADNVASTLGPRGRNVILFQKGDGPIITKDGVTVAKFVELDDPFENAGVQVLKQAASQTNSEAGDGTTTTTVLARAILKEAQKHLAAGAAPIELKRGIDKAVEAVTNSLKSVATPISSEEDVTHIATISSNGDTTIGKLIGRAVDLAGSITIEEARAIETSLEVEEGFRFDSGYLAAAFITDEKRGVVKYEDPLVLVTDEKIDSVDELMPVLEIVARETRPFIIVASEVEGQALAALIMNTVRGTLKVAAVKAPRYGEERRNILKDLALSIDATFVSRENNIRLREVKLKDLGRVSTFESTKNFTTIVGGEGSLDEVERKIDQLKVEITNTDDIHECEKIQERITRLASGVAIIRVGAATEVEMIEKKHRVEDALEAVRSAQQEGIVPGGGIALIRAVAGLEVEVENNDQRLGVEIVFEAVKAPLRQMALNAGKSPDILISLVEKAKFSHGINFSTGELVDMLDTGIIDPVKVVRCALQNAASVASTLITANHAIVVV